MQKFFSRLGNNLGTAYKDCAIFRTRAFPKADVVFECHDTHRAVKINGRAYAQILDGFQDELSEEGYECITFAQQGSRIVDNAYGKVFSPTTVFEEAVGLLVKAFLGKDFYRSKYKSWLFKRALSKVSCTLVVAIQPTKSLVKACNLLGIPVVDLFHGYCTTPNHQKYGYDSIKALRKEFLCSDYVALDSHSKSVIEESLRRAKKEARSWSYLSPVLKKVVPYIPAALETFVEGYRKTFLVTLQWGIDRFEKAFPHVDGELHPRLRDTITLGIEKGFAFIIKPHPHLLMDGAILTRLREYCDTETALWLEEERDLHTLLRLADAHITIFSSSTREAALLGKKTVLFSSDDEFFEGDDYYFKKEIESRIAVRVSQWNLKEIVDYLETLEAIGGQEKGMYVDLMPDYYNAACLVEELFRRNGYSYESPPTNSI